jgi:hypothetical protein
MKPSLFTRLHAWITGGEIVWIISDFRTEFAVARGPDPEGRWMVGSFTDSRLLLPDFTGRGTFTVGKFRWLFWEGKAKP